MHLPSMQGAVRELSPSLAATDMAMRGNACTLGAQTPEGWPVYRLAHGQILFLFLGGAARLRLDLRLRFPFGRAAQKQKEQQCVPASLYTGHPSGVWVKANSSHLAGFCDGQRRQPGVRKVQRECRALQPPSLLQAVTTPQILNLCLHGS